MLKQLGRPIIFPTAIFKRIVFDNITSSAFDNSDQSISYYQFCNYLALADFTFSNTPVALSKRIDRNSTDNLHNVKDTNKICNKLRLEYAENVMDKIIDGSDDFTEILTSITNAVNCKALSVNDFFNIIYTVYSAFLQKENKLGSQGAS